MRTTQDQPIVGSTCVLLMLPHILLKDTSENLGLLDTLAKGEKLMNRRRLPRKFPGSRYVR